VAHAWAFLENQDLPPLSLVCFCTVDKSLLISGKRISLREMSPLLCFVSHQSVAPIEREMV
jgi:hypothetical protein